VSRLAVRGPAPELAALRAALDDVIASGAVAAEGVVLTEGSAPDEGHFQVEIELATASS
jgi:hypothetical protein